MGVRPPSNDVDDEPNTMEFGIAALDAHVEQRNISFPISREELDTAHGDVQIAVNASGRKIALSTVLADCDSERFESKQNLLNELHPIFERKREQLSGGIIGQLRSLLPF